MLDGIRLSKDQLAVAAIGITTEGRKHVLDFELGSSESAEVAKDLMRRLMKRGFHCDRPLLAVLDGSDALRSAVKEFFPAAIVQRCLVHKERTYARSYRRSTGGASWLDYSSGFGKSRAKKPPWKLLARSRDSLKARMLSL